MALYKGGLGRGIDALLAENDTSRGGVTVLRLADIEPNRAQVRKTFDPETIAELADSIKEHGLLQPIIVRRKGNGFYEIIAGEHRWRACKEAGLVEVPVIIKDMDDRSASLAALVENLQREDLDPVEEARGYESLMREYGMTQEEAAFSVGKSRPSVANKLRILSLPEKVLSALHENRITFGHARALLPLAENTRPTSFARLPKRSPKKAFPCARPKTASGACSSIRRSLSKARPEKCAAHITAGSNHARRQSSAES